MKATDLKIGQKLTLVFRATVTTASLKNDDRKAVVREIENIVYNSNGNICHLFFKGMKSEFRPSNGEDFYLYAITGPTREYIIVD
jgi:hypothetical protein